MRRGRSGRQNGQTKISDINASETDAFKKNLIHRKRGNMSQAAGAGYVPRDSYYIVGRTEQGFPIYKPTGPIGHTGPPGPNSVAGQHCIGLGWLPKDAVMSDDPTYPSNSTCRM